MHEIVENFILKNNLKTEAEAWPLLKSHMTRERIFSEGVSDFQFKSKLSTALVICMLISFCNLFFARFRRRKTGYFGAFSRVSIRGGIMHDEFVSGAKLKEVCLLYHSSIFLRAYPLACIKRGIIFENLVIRVFCIFIKRFGRFSRSLSLSQDFLELLVSEYGVSSKQVNGILLDYECKKVAYKKLYKWLRIRNVEVVSAYTKPAIVSAANELCINTLEYQHGLLAPYHPSYHFAGIKLWPSSMLPARLILSSRFWQSKMCKANYVLEDHIKIDNVLTKSSREMMRQVFELVGTDRFFIFTGQGMFYKEIAEFISGLIEEFPGYTVVYRPHPREYSNHTHLSALVMNDNFKVLDRDAFQDTLTLISSSKAHFSVYSSCHFEALELLGRTFVLDIMENNIMKEGGADEKIIFITKASQILHV